MRAAWRWTVLTVAVAGAALLLARPEAPAAAAPRAEPDYFAFVPSMAGTRPDGALRTNADERLEVNAELAYLFDYYLAGLGERPLETVRAEIIRELDRRLPAGAATEARRLLDAYLAYKQALAEVERGLQQGAVAGTAGVAQRARQRLEAMRQLRANYFSEAEIAGLFGASDAYDLDAIARMEIGADASLDEAGRQRRLAALDAQLPAAVKAEREAPSRVLRLAEAVSQARAGGADENEIYRLRSAALSPAAAGRLAEVDREEAEWQRRITAYQAQRRQLLQTTISEAAQQQLRDAGFSTDEQKRLPAYE